MVVVAKAPLKGSALERRCSNITLSSSASFEEAPGLLPVRRGLVEFWTRFGGWDGSSESGLESRLRRGVPAEIVVATDWLRAMRVSAAAPWSAEMIEGPGSR